VTEAFSRFDDKPVTTKHNRAGRGIGMQMACDRKALLDYVNGADFKLCPGDFCALDASTCMADVEPLFAFDAINGLGDSALGASLAPRM
tara:strand:+ start:163 stop:429 length:267 start_codon:yes stop_codon:yes gene_type:complete